MVTKVLLAVEASRNPTRIPAVDVADFTDG